MGNLVKDRKIWFFYAIFYGLTVAFFIFYPSLLTNISRIYQRGYRCWNIDYAGLGEKGFVHRLKKERRLLCKSDAYSPEFEEFLWDIKSHLALRGRVLQDYPRSRKTYLLDIEGVPYIVKKSYKLPFMESFFYSSRYSRNAWNNAERARKSGFKTYEPVALVEFGHHLRFVSYLLYPCEGNLLEEKKGQIEDWIGVFKETLEYQKSLRILHSDFHAKNVLQLNDKSIRYIDIDDLHWYPQFSYMYHIRFRKELKRFTQDFPPSSLEL